MFTNYTQKIVTNKNAKPFKVVDLEPIEDYGGLILGPRAILPGMIVEHEDTGYCGLVTYSKYETNVDGDKFTLVIDTEDKETATITVETDGHDAFWGAYEYAVACTLLGVDASLNKEDVAKIKTMLDALLAEDEIELEDDDINENVEVKEEDENPKVILENEASEEKAEEDKVEEESDLFNYYMKRGDKLIKDLMADESIKRNASNLFQSLADYFKK